MKKTTILFLIILNLGVLLMGEMESYLPQPNELKNYVPSGTPQYVMGEDLFFMIDGGAEIYHEYGFKQAIAQGFKKKDGTPGGGFNLEIYEMINPEAAYGIYTFKTGNKGQTLDIGDESLLEDYYLNLRKGSFLVTITGFDPGQETIAALIDAAGIVAAKIKTDGFRITPPLIQLLPDTYKNRLKSNGIKYMKGNLALFNQYEFDSINIFELKEGVMGDYGDFKLFLFKYASESECRQCFEKGKASLHQNPRFQFRETQHEATAPSFFMTDGKGTPFYIKNNGPHIYIVQGQAKESAEEIIDTIQK